MLQTQFRQKRAYAVFALKFVKYERSKLLKKSKQSKIAHIVANANTKNRIEKHSDNRNKNRIGSLSEVLYHIAHRIAV